jgi:hypothetical protein
LPAIGIPPEAKAARGSETHRREVILGRLRNWVSPGARHVVKVVVVLV